MSGEPVKEIKKQPMRRYVRPGLMPTIFCAGCGGGTVLNCFTRAVDELGLDPKGMCMVTGIGCSSWIPSPYFLADTLHTTHGRAIAFATGVRVMAPKMKVVVIAGDGDISGIGGNHLIHAARRNMDLLVVCVNNMIYAMTGGQAAATTPGAAISTTTPYGSFEPELNMAHLVDAAGASFVARWTVFHVKMLEKTMKEALSKKGFRFIEVLSPCPTLYGRRNNLADGLAAMKDYKERSKVRNGAPTHETALVQGGEIIVGKFVDRERPDYLTLMRQQLGTNYHPLPPQPDENPEAGVAKEDCCSC